MAHRWHRLRTLAQASLLLVAMLTALPALADVADQMKQMIEQKRPKDAYELGMKHPELMGDPYFDYVFGAAAIDSGRPSIGVLALERVMLSNPNNDVARLELARGYFTLGEYQRAQEEFDVVRKHHPPSGVESTINIYLDAIKDKEGAIKINGNLFAEIGGGWNSNVNTATAVSNLILPIVGPVQLGSTSQPQPSGFSFLSAGGQLNVPLTKDVLTFANINGSRQAYTQVNGYNLSVGNALLGTKVMDGPNGYKIAGFASLAQMDQVPVPNTGGGAVEYERQLTGTQSVSASYGFTNLSYAQQFSGYNSNLNVGTLAYRNLFPNTFMKPVIDVIGNAGKQTSTQNRSDQSRNIYGGGLQLSFLPKEKWGVSTGVAYAQYDYVGNDLLYLQGRVDNLYSANGVVQYKLGDGWSTRMELTYYNNQSNLQLYTYQQFTGALKLRYDWDSK